MIKGGTILFNGGNDYMKNDTIEKRVLKELYNYLTDDYIKKKKIKNYIKLKEDLTMLYYFKYLKRKNKDNILIINRISNSQYNACVEINGLIQNNNIYNKEKLTISK